VLLLAWAFLPPAQPVRGKYAPPAPTDRGPDQAAAAKLALADARGKARLGPRAEVLAVLPAGHQLTPSSLACALSDCRLVEIYDFGADTTLSVVVDLRASLVRDVLVQPHIHPQPNQRLTDLAIALARQSPDFIRELGRVPQTQELTPMASGIPGGACAHGHYCLAVTAPQGRSLVWAIIDATTSQLVTVLRTPVPAEAEASAATAAAPAGLSGGNCPAGGSVARNGWSLNYETTPTDSFRVYDASYLGVPVLTSAKIAEWHVAYGTSGFVDEPGCHSYIAPYGATVVNDLLDGSTVVGFEVVQDFRMSNWGAICNYR